MFCECRTATHELITCEIYRCKECGAYIGEGQNHLERPQGGFVHVACTRRPSGQVKRLDVRTFDDEPHVGGMALSSSGPGDGFVNFMSGTTGDYSTVARRRGALK